MKKILKATVTFLLLFIAAAYLLTLRSQGQTSQDLQSELIIAVNEISQLMQNGETPFAVQKTEELQDRLRVMPLESGLGKEGILLCVLAVVFMTAVFVYVYISILRPFEKMKAYAAEIAKGNFDIPLDYDRSDYFGAFTWAFDSMRKEIIRSRACEREAIENNKTIIATLSHDIKTPVASIRAYAEGLEANLDVSPERRARYLSVMMKKCDEVSALTDDLLLHSLSDMDRLYIKADDIDIIGLIEQTAAEISGEKGDVVFQKPDFSAIVHADKKRIIQLTENLINNARKYAHTDTEIFFTQTDGMIEIHFCDTGEGIPDEDMPFITGKFYRGRNCGDENGSGLGLYIVKYIAEQSGGSLTLMNREKGLEAVVSLPIKKS